MIPLNADFMDQLGKALADRRAEDKDIIEVGAFDGNGKPLGTTEELLKSSPDAKEGQGDSRLFLSLPPTSSTPDEAKTEGECKKHKAEDEKCQEECKKIKINASIRQLLNLPIKDGNEVQSKEPDSDPVFKMPISTSEWLQKRKESCNARKG